MSCITSIDEVIKHPDDILNVSMDFTDALESGETISSQTVVSLPTGITITNITSGDCIVTFTIADGTAGTNYVIEVTIETSESQTIAGLGKLKIRNQ